MERAKDTPAAANDVIISPHALSRMVQRVRREEDVRHIAAHGASTPDAAPAGAAPRTRISGTRNGRTITVVIAHEAGRQTVITAF